MRQHINVRLFIKTFLLTALLLFAMVFGVTATIFLNQEIGSGQAVDVPLDKVDSHKDRQNILLIGTDKSGVLADVMMIFSFSDDGDPVNVMSIQRDTEVTINGRIWKINSVYQLGIDRLVEEIRGVTGIPIHDFAVVNFNAVKVIVDELDGVDYNVPQNMHYEDPEQDLYIHLSAGQQHLNGERALQLLRFRSYPQGDIRRTEVQRDFLKEMFKQKATMENIDKIDEIYSAVSENVITTEGMRIIDIVNYATLAQGCEMITYPMPCTETGKSSGTVVVDAAEMKKLADEHFITEEKYLQ